MSRFVPRVGKFFALVVSLIPILCANAEAWVTNARPGSINDSVLAITYTTSGQCVPGTWKHQMPPSDLSYSVNVNGQFVQVVGLLHGPTYWGGVGSFDGQRALVEGQNQFSFNFESVCPDSQGGGEVVLEYYAKGKRVGSTICRNHFRYGNTTIQCNLALKDLSEIDPDLFQQIERLKTEIRSLQDEANRAAAEAKDLGHQGDALRGEIDEILSLVEELKNILAGLTGLDFDQLSTEKLARLIEEHSDIGTVFNRLKGEIDHLRQQVSHETTVVQNETTQLVSELKNQFQAGADLDVNLDFLEEDIEAAFSAKGFDLPKASESYGVNLFQAASNETIQKLQAAETKGNATEFLSIVKIWTHWQNETDEAMQRMHPTAATCHALNQAKTQVLDYVKSQVDKDGFFWKARIPDSVKRVVGKLKDWDEKLGYDLKEELNTWQETLNPTQLQVVEVISSLDPVLEKFKDPRLQSENSDPRLEDARNIAQVALKVATENLIRAAREAVDSRPSDLESEEGELTPAEEYLVQAQTGVQLASGFADVALGVADFAIGLSPAGSIKDLVEAMTGVSVLHPAGEKLEIWQRGFLAVTGVAGIITLGGSNVVTKASTKVFKVVEEIWMKSKISPALSGKILRNAEKIIEYVKRAGLRTREAILDFFTSFEKIVGNEVGAIGNIEKVLESADRNWTSVRGLLHTVKGNAKLAADGTFKLKSGMHTEKGLEHFIQLNANRGKNYTIQTVTSFGERNMTPGVIFKEKLPNGVTKLQMPRDAWHNQDAFGKARFATATDKWKGIKTLWPESFSVSDIAEAAEQVLAQNPNVSDSVVDGIYKGIKTVVTRDQAGKIITVYPKWIQ